MKLTRKDERRARFNKRKRGKKPSRFHANREGRVARQLQEEEPFNPLAWDECENFSLDKHDDE